MPFGFKTLSGLRPDMEELYGMREHESTTYPPRTEANVMDADATICIATDLDSPGEQCTRRFIKQHRKPHFIVHLDKLGWQETEVSRAGLSWVEPIVSWVRLVNPRVLNVAGNSERTSPGVQARAKKLLVETFMALNIGKFATLSLVRLEAKERP